MAAAKTGTITKFKKAVKSFIPYGIVYIVKRSNARKKKELVFNKPLSPKAYADKYSAYRSSETVCKNWILYESYGGAGMIGNPWAIFKAFRRRNDFGAYQHIWVILKNDELNRLSKEYRNVPNVRFILYGSEAYGYYLARSEYLVNNVSFPFFFAVRPEQHYLNTWHSITVKALGYDMPDGNRLTNNMERNFLMTDYIVSPNAFMTDIFNQSF